MEENTPTTLQANIEAALREMVTQVLSITGRRVNLGTTDKTSLVAAINELKASIDNIDAGGDAGIDDETTATDTTWSSQKITTAMSAALEELKTQLVDGAPAALDTLKELADAIAANTDLYEALRTLADTNAENAAEAKASADRAQQVADSIWDTLFDVLGRSLIYKGAVDILDWDIDETQPLPAWDGNDNPPYTTFATPKINLPAFARGETLEFHLPILAIQTANVGRIASAQYRILKDDVAVNGDWHNIDSAGVLNELTISIPGPLTASPWHVEVRAFYSALADAGGEFRTHIVLPTYTRQGSLAVQLRNIIDERIGEHPVSEAIGFTSKATKTATEKLVGDLPYTATIDAHELDVYKASGGGFIETETTAANGNFALLGGAVNNIKAHQGYKLQMRLGEGAWETLPGPLGNTGAYFNYNSGVASASAIEVRGLVPGEDVKANVDIKALQTATAELPQIAKTSKKNTTDIAGLQETIKFIPRISTQETDYWRYENNTSYEPILIGGFNTHGAPEDDQFVLEAITTQDGDLSHQILVHHFATNNFKDGNLVTESVNNTWGFKGYHASAITLTAKTSEAKDDGATLIDIFDIDIVEDGVVYAINGIPILKVIDGVLNIVSGHTEEVTTTETITTNEKGFTSNGISDLWINWGSDNNPNDTSWFWETNIPTANTEGKDTGFHLQIPYINGNQEPNQQTPPIPFGMANFIRSPDLKDNLGYTYPLYIQSRYYDNNTNVEGEIINPTSNLAIDNGHGTNSFNYKKTTHPVHTTHEAYEFTPLTKDDETTIGLGHWTIAIVPQTYNNRMEFYIAIKDAHENVFLVRKQGAENHIIVIPYSISDDLPNILDRDRAADANITRRLGEDGKQNIFSRILSLLQKSSIVVTTELLSVNDGPAGILNNPVAWTSQSYNIYGLLKRTFKENVLPVLRINGKNYATIPTPDGVPEGAMLAVGVDGSIEYLTDENDEHVIHTPNPLIPLLIEANAGMGFKVGGMGNLELVNLASGGGGGTVTTSRGYGHLGTGTGTGSGLVLGNQTIANSPTLQSANGVTQTLRYDDGLTGYSIPIGATYNETTGDLILPEGQWVVCASCLVINNLTNGNQGTSRLAGNIQLHYNDNVRHGQQFYIRLNSGIDGNETFQSRAWASVTGVVKSNGTNPTNIVINLQSENGSPSLGGNVEIQSAHLHIVPAYTEITAGGGGGEVKVSIFDYIDDMTNIITNIAVEKMIGLQFSRSANDQYDGYIGIPRRAGIVVGVDKGWRISAAGVITPVFIQGFTPQKILIYHY